MRRFLACYLSSHQLADNQFLVRAVSPESKEGLKVVLSGFEFTVLQAFHSLSSAEDVSEILLPKRTGANFRSRKAHCDRILKTTDRLRRLGLLQSERSVCNSLPKNSHSLSISRMIFLTKDNPDGLCRALESFGQHVKECGRNIIFTIADDSRDPDAQKRNVEVAKFFRRKYGIKTTLFDRRDRTKFANLIAHRASIDPRFVLDNLLGFSHAAMSVGANRNSAMLCSLGEGILSTDDDLLAGVIRPPHFRGGLTFSGATNCERVYHGIPDRIDIVPDINIFDIHEKLLGKPTGILPGHLTENEKLSVQYTNPDFLKRIQNPTSHIATTSFGLVGDSGTELPHPYFNGSPYLTIGLLSDEKTYRKLLYSHKVQRGVTDWTISDAGSFLASHIGLDNRTLLPPFFPNFRNEDGLFMEVLLRADPGAVLGYLPFALRHAVKDERIRKRNAKSLTTLWRVNDSLISLLEAIPFKRDSEVKRNLESIGNFFQDSGKMQTVDFSAMIVETFTKRMTGHLQFYESQFHSEELPEFYRRDMKAFVNRLRRSFRTPRHLPDDFQKSFKTSSVSLLQKCMGSYGRILTTWSEIQKLTKDFYKKEIRLDREINNT